ncbi:MAG TPA: hypothetical protein VFT78_06360 [Hanamia sp.]|nr:hypothetical protein [Hanamia sp.]
MNFQTINRQRKFILIIAAIGIISVFLPWISISIFGSTESRNGFHGLGILVFILFLSEAIITRIGNLAQPLEKNHWFLVILYGGIGLLSVVIKITSFSNTTNGDLVLPYARLGAGIWLCLASSAAIILFAWLFKNPSHNLKNGYEGLKRSISIPISSLSEPVSKEKYSVRDNINEFEKPGSLKDHLSHKSEDQTSL